MLLAEKYASHFPLFFSSSPKKPSPAPPAAPPLAGVESKLFEETLTRRLSSLLPLPDTSPSIPLSWLSRAADLLTLTLADLTATISQPSLPAADLSALSSHLDSATALLHACNAISSQIDRILHRRLLLRHALRSPSSERLRRAISGEASPERDLSRLGPRDLNGGSSSAVRRAVYAAEAISDLVARCVAGLLGRRGGFGVGFRVSTDFGWAGVYNEIVEGVCGEVWCGEIEAVEMSVRELAVVVAGEEIGGGGELTEGLRSAVRGVEEVVEELTEGIDGLVVAVNAVFRAGLESREAALRRFRVGAGGCD